MKHTLQIALNTPQSLYRPEFVRRSVEFLRAVCRKLRHPNYHLDRTELSELACAMLRSPRFRCDAKDQSWQTALVTLVTRPGDPLLQFAVSVELPDDVDRNAFKRRLEALFEALELELAAARPDGRWVAYRAHELVDTPREFNHTVRSEAGHVPAWGA